MCDAPAGGGHAAVFRYNRQAAREPAARRGVLDGGLRYPGAERIRPPVNSFCYRATGSFFSCNHQRYCAG